MRINRNLPLVVVLVCSLHFSASAADLPPAPEWDQALDGIHAVTWRGQAAVDAELKKVEDRTRQDLTGYIAAWERRMATPIVYSGTERSGDACGPLSYCAADFRDPRRLMMKLREQKEPVAHFLYGRLSPETRKIIDSADAAVDAGAKTAGGAATANGPSSETMRLLAGELTRIVREDGLYTAERFAGIHLSPAATALVSEHNDARNRVCVNKTLLAEAFPQELSRNFKCVIQKDDAYRRVVAAKTVQYLRKGDKKLLDEAITLGENLENKLMYTDVAFWYYYPRALADIQARNSAALNYDANALLNFVVLWGEPPESGKPSPAEQEQHNYVWNLADLVLTRGIRDAHMEGLEAVGPAVWLLGNRTGIQAVGEQEQELQQRIADVRKFLSGPESDNFRLNYAVAMLEGEKKSTQLTQALNAGEKGALAAKLFGEAREYLRLAYAWAGTVQGKATAVSHYLELVNLALVRMKDILPPATYAALAETPDAINADLAVSLYREMATPEKDGWEELRFVDRKAYINSAHRLWNALRKNSLLVGDFYLQKTDRDDFQSVMDTSEPAEKSFLRYVHLFDAATTDGHREIIPDSAYFAYAEALKKLSRLKRLVYAYNKEMKLHNQSISHLLKGLTVYPYDDSISEYAAVTRNINTGSFTMLPDMVISSVAANNVIAKCLQGNASYCDRNDRQSLEWNIYKVRNKIYGNRDINRLDDLKALVSKWKNEPRSPGKMTRLDTQRGTVLTLAERYGALSGQLSAQAADAMGKFTTCSAAGIPCEATRETADRLLAKRDEAEKEKNDLFAAVGAFRQLLDPGQGTAWSRKELGYAADLSAIVNDVSVNQTDQALEVGIQKKLYDLRTTDNHPMHKIIKAGFFSS